MSVGVEIRVPLLDLHLVELAAKLPPNFKQRSGRRLSLKNHGTLFAERGYLPS